MAAGASPSSSVKKTVQTRSQPLAGQKCGGGESKFTGRLAELFEVQLPALGKGPGFVKRIRTKPREPERALGRCSSRMITTGLVQVEIHRDTDH